MTKDEEKVVAGSLKNTVRAAPAWFTPDRFASGQHRTMAEPGSTE